LVTLVSNSADTEIHVQKKENPRFSTIMPKRKAKPHIPRDTIPRNRIPSIKIKENATSHAPSKKKRVHVEEISSSPPSILEDADIAPQVNNDKDLPSPPPVPDINYFILARAFIGTQCIHRFIGETKVYLFSVQDFLLDVEDKVAKWEAEKDVKAVQKSSKAKVTFKAMKSNEVLEVEVLDDRSFISQVDSYIKFLHTSNKKALRVDWTVQYVRAKELNKSELDITSESEKERPSTPLKEKRSTQVIAFNKIAKFLDNYRSIASSSN
jgi:hypothetical protein